MRMTGRVMIGEHPLYCVICRGEVFTDREVKLNTTGMELLDLAWANQSALGLVCGRCGYVHLFLNGGIRMMPA